MYLKVFVLALLSFRPELGMDTAEKWAVEILAASVVYKVDPPLVLAVMWRESRLQPGAVSDKCAAGLGQILVKPCDRREVRRLKRPLYNIRRTVEALAEHRHRCAVPGPRDAEFRRKYCRPHWVQSYNPRKVGYAKRVMETQTKIMIMLKHFAEIISDSRLACLDRSRP